MEVIEAAVRAANRAFYTAFQERNLQAMEALWAREAPVACMHPGMAVLLGRAAVMNSWRGILRHPSAPTLLCSNVRVHLLGTSAYVTCLEGAADGRPKLIATNVFTLEDGHWRLVHHHAGPLSPAVSAEPAKKKPSLDPSQLN